MKKIAEKVLVYLVLVVMLFEAVPVAAFAEELQSDAATIALDYSEPQKLDIILPEYTLASNEFTVSSVEDLGGLIDAVSQPVMIKKGLKKAQAVEAVDKKQQAESITGYAAFDIKLTEEAKRAKTYSVPVVFDTPIDMLGGGYASEDILIVNVSYALYHFLEDGSYIEVTDVEADWEENLLNGFSFTTDSFSEFLLQYTVDFVYIADGETYELSLAGGDCVTLGTLAAALGIVPGEQAQVFTRDVAEAEFSSPVLAYVGQVEADTTVGAFKDAIGLACEYSAELTAEDIAAINGRALSAGDWVLISLQPFTTPEILTLRMTNGRVYEISVSDAQIKKTVITESGEAYDITVTYEPAETGIPEDADLEVRELLDGAEDYAAYVAKTEEALGMEEGSAGYIRLFDIKIVDKGDPAIKYQPANGTSVDVRIELADKDATKEAAESTQVVHFADENDAGSLVDAATDGQTVTFEAAGFSIYAIVDSSKRLKYNFYDGTNLLVTEYIKKQDNVLQELYDPGVEPEYGQTFVGWAYSPNETNPSNIYTIDDLNQQAAARYNSATEELTEINVYAIYDEAWYLRYMDQDAEGNATVLNVVRVRKDAANKNVTIDYTFTPEEGIVFDGWIDVATGDTYQQGNTITLDHHVDLYVKLHGRNWLVFDSNAGGPGSGATYTPPQLLIGDTATTTKPDDPTRRGYTFTGWNTKADGTGTWWYRPNSSVNLFGNTLPNDTTLYAQWEANDTDYHVVFWKQSANDKAGLADSSKTYDYVSSEKRSAKTGTTVNLTNADKQKGGTTGSEYGYYFTYNANISDNTATVDANGTTILNVYYDRREITYSFQEKNGYANAGTPNWNSGTSYFYRVGNNYYQCYRIGNNTYYYTQVTGNLSIRTIYYINVDGEWYSYSYNSRYGQFVWSYYGTYYTWTGQVYSRNQVTGWNPTYYVENWETTNTFTGLYGSAFEDWPDTGADMVWQEITTTMLFPLALTEYDPQSAYTDETTATSVTFRSIDYDTGTTLVIYKQTVDGTWEYTDENIITTANLGNSGRWYPTETFTGFELDAYRLSENGEWISITPTGSVDYDGYLDLRYARNQHSIHFISQGTHVTERTEEIVDGVYYESSLRKYEEGGSAYYEPTNGREGYYFAGWYADADCQVPFDFNITMPDNDIIVYAKWDTYRVRVVLVPTPDNAHNDEVEFANNQALSFRLDYNEQVDNTNINSGVAKRPGYKLIGWYYSPDFDPATEIHFPVLINKYTHGVDMNYQSGEDWSKYGDNDGEHENVRGILKLYAKWELDVDENSVYVEYDVDDVYRTYDTAGMLQTTIPVDDNKYALTNNNVTFQVAEAPTEYTSGFEFYNWVLLNPDGSESNITFIPAEMANVDPSTYIYTETITDDAGNTATIKKLRLKAKFNIEAEKVTTVTFDGNGGVTNDSAARESVTESYPINKDFLMKDADSFVREGHKLIGWAFQRQDGSKITVEAFKNAVATMTADQLVQAGIYLPGQKVAADNLEVSGENNWNPLENTVYAIWEWDTTLNFTKTVEVGGTLRLDEVDHTIYIALTKGDKQTYVRTGSNEWDPILFKKIEIKNGVPDPATVTFEGLEPGEYNVWELKEQPSNTATRLGVSDVFPIQGSSPAENFAVQKITGNNNATLVAGQVTNTALTNTYAKENEVPILFEARKVWIDRQANIIADADMPENATATFSLFREINGNTDTTPVASITLNGEADAATTPFGTPNSVMGQPYYQEDEPWHATFGNLPRVDGSGNRIIYKVKETAATPDGFYPWKEKSENNELCGPDWYLTNSGGVIYNRKLTMSIRLDKHFDFQPNNGNELAVTYDYFKTDKTTQEKLSFTVTLPTGETRHFKLSDFEPVQGVTTFSLTLEDIPYYTGLYAPADYNGSTITFQESGEFELLEAYNYYLVNIMADQGTQWSIGGERPTTVTATRTESMNINADDPLYEVRIQNKYRRGAEGRFVKLTKKVTGLTNEDFLANSGMLQNLHFVIKNKAGLYAGHNPTPAFNPETMRYEKLLWVQNVSDAVIISPTFNYNASNGQWEASVNFDNFNDFPSDEYTVVELEALEGGYEGKTAQIQGYTLTVKDNTITVETKSDGTSEWEDSYNYNLSVTNAYERIVGSVNFTKVDEKDAALAGATFALYTDQNCTTPAQNKDGENATATSAEGTGLVEFQNIPTGTYYMKETEAPEGYAVSNNVYQVVIVEEPESSTIKLYENDAATGEELSKIPNTPSNKYLRIKKVGDDSAGQSGLVGAEFSLKADHPVVGFVDKETLTSMDGANLGYLPSGDTSDATLFTLPIGTYTLTETKVPLYYEGINGPVTIEVTNTGITVTEMAGVSLSEPENNVYTLTITNTHTGSIKISKTDDKQNSLTGATFQLFSVDMEGTLTPFTTAMIGEQTLSEGIINMSADSVVTVNNIPSGKYKLVETHAPNGFMILPSGIEFTVNVNEGVTTIHLIQGQGASTEAGTITIVNTPGVQLPSTGGPGTVLYTAAGLSLLLGASLWLMLRRRKEQQN